MPEGTLVTAITTGIVIFAAVFVVATRLGRTDARLDRVRSDAPAPPPTVPELVEIVLRKVVPRLDPSRLKSLDSEAAKRDLRRVAEHVLDTENPLINRLEREAVIKAVVERMTANRPE